MRRLSLGMAALALLTSVPAVADPINRWRAYIAEASSRFAIPPEWIEQVMRAESGGRTECDGRPITSRAGAMGLMQLMPGTWQDMRVRLGLGRDPHHPRHNILAGSLYLRLMHDRFGYPGLFAAYNAGPARYAAHLSGRDPLPAETRAYVASVTGGNVRPLAVPQPPSRSPLFFELRHVPHGTEGEVTPRSMIAQRGLAGRD